jgi:hypothetical protein
MSYVTQDRHGACTIKYATIKSKEVAGTGKTWWPDYGPSLRDHSFQEKFAPHHHIFEKVVKPHTVGYTPPPLPEHHERHTQFRHPAPAREGMLCKDHSLGSNEQRLAAKAITDRQAALRVMEVRQRKIDSWLEDTPMRMAAIGSSSKAKTLGRAGSEPALPTQVAAQASREVYEKLGFLVGRSKGTSAGGFSGATVQRKHNPLSLNALMFSGNVVDSSRASRSLSRSSLPKKPSKQWQVLPESGFVFDPRTSLPVPRGGWNSQPQTTWPEATAAGHREWSAPVTFDARPKGGSMDALTEYPQSPSAAERRVPAGSAGETVRKVPYGAQESGGQSQPVSPMALETMRTSGTLGKASSNAPMASAE